jgi:hypothetical protein
LAAWTEPDNSGTFNIVEVTPIPGTVSSGFYNVTVASDVPNPNSFPVIPNGGSAVLDNIYVTFHDDGDSPVPDGGSTGILLGIGLIGLASLGALRLGVRQLHSA